MERRFRSLVAGIRKITCHWAPALSDPKGDQAEPLPAVRPMKEHKVVGLAVGFFVVVCLSDAVFESLVFQEKPFWSSLIRDVSTHDLFLRSVVTLSFLVFGLIVSRSLARQRGVDQALAERSQRLSEINALLTKEITERTQLERELMEKEQKYRTIADFTYDWEFWMGPTGEFLWVSPSCERVTGYSSYEFTQDSSLFERIIHPEDRDLVMGHVHEPIHVDQIRTYSLDFRIVSKDGQLRWINNVCRPVIGTNGTPLGRRASNRDITARVDAERALKESEERFRQIYQLSPVMMHSIDESGIIRNVNGRWLEVMGYSRDQVLGRSISSVMTAESAHRAQSEVLPRYWRDGFVKDVPYQYVTKDGTIIDVLLDSVVMNDPVWGRISLSTVRDITLRKKAAEEARRTKALLDSIVENLPISVFLKDADSLKYLLWNRASEELHGYSREEMIGKTSRDFFPASQAEQFMAQDRQVLTTGTLLCVPEHPVDTKTQGTRIVQIKKVPIYEDDGKPRYLLAIAEDITERKEFEQALIVAREQAEQASRVKSEFLANMSHEIRTPINGIMGMTELALNTELTLEQHEYLDAIRVSADSLLKVIDDILDFSKIEAGKLELIDVAFSLRDTVAESMTILAVQAHRKNLELAYHIPSGVPDALIGDPGRLRQILVNLVGNSVKFTDMGEVVVRVEQAMESHEEVHLHFTVTDTGIGVPPDKRDKIFQAFEQADGSTSRKYGGTGLGLAICSQFVRMMGGKIWIESEVGKGSTFHFIVRFGLQKESVGPALLEEIADLKDLDVLVVDDNATNRRILEETFLLWRARPVLVESGLAALSALEQASDDGRPFRLVITDCMMPGMDGFELAERMSSDKRFSASPVIMLTSTGEYGDASRCIRLGIAAYLLKPVKQSELLYTISRILRRPSTNSFGATLLTQHSIRQSEKRLRVLLAEDNPINQKLAVRLLERMGHTVSVAENGRDALKAFESMTFDLVLMDVQMPEMDGLEATRVLREREKETSKRLPVIAMTAFAMNGDKERCLEAGMDGYIAKPISAGEVYQVIEHIIGLGSTRASRPSDSTVRAPALDMAALIDRVGGDDDLLHEIAALFLDDYPRLLAEIREAFHQEDPERLEKAAHTLKGAVSTFGAESATEAAFRLETMGRERDLTNASNAIMYLEREIELMAMELAAVGKEVGQ